MRKIIARGAEAIIIRNNSKIVIKSRIPKGYRHPALDEKLRAGRTRREAKLLEKAIQVIPAPKIVATNEQKKELELEYVSGKKLADHFDNLKNKISIARQIGHSLAKLHDAGLVHGDLTTSNLILKGSKVYFIDFGLGYHSSKVEDYATDLHVLKEALEAKHPKNAAKIWKAILQGYSLKNKSKEIITRLEKVESRGRYKGQY